MVYCADWCVTWRFDSWTLNKGGWKIAGRIWCSHPIYLLYLSLSYSKSHSKVNVTKKWLKQLVVFMTKQRETRAAQNQPLKPWIGSFAQKNFLRTRKENRVCSQRGMRAIFIIIFVLFSLLQKTVWYQLFLLAFVANVLPSRSQKFLEAKAVLGVSYQHNFLLNSSAAVSYYIRIPLFKFYPFSTII